jgi:hypothetical protein
MESLEKRRWRKLLGRNFYNKWRRESFEMKTRLAYRM